MGPTDPANPDRNAVPAPDGAWTAPAAPEEGAEAAVTVLEPPEPEVDPTGRLLDPGANRFHWGTGRRKASVARVRIRPGSGEFLVNGRPADEYFDLVTAREIVRLPVTDLKAEAKVDVFACVHGGGPTGQGGAVRLGLARALALLYPDAHDFLRQRGHLTRDPRMVERKKYGRAGARRSFQWVKR